jgi:glycosyltransferase involved in cell wall biosynthesis
MSKIVFAIRHDAPAKPGGDSSKVLKYASLIRSVGFDTEVVYSLSGLRLAKPSLVHLVNIDLPLENSIYLQWCHRHGIPYVISTIHHPIEAMEAYYYRAKYNRANHLLRSFGIDFETYSISRERISLLLKKEIKAASFALNSKPRELQKRILANSTRIFPMTIGEHRSIEHDISPTEAVIIPNPLTFPPGQETAARARREGLICVGRIEPRKNQLGIAEALRENKIPVTFIGKVNRQHPDYIRRFFTHIETCSHFTYVEALPQEQLAAYYRAARLHVSLSWFEVVSQVDLEALSLGCNIVSTRYGHLRDYVDHMQHEYDPITDYENHSKIRELLLNAYESEARPLIKNEMKYSWQDVSQMLADEYRRILN